MTPKTPARATELEYLKWFWLNADFGPADSDVRQYLNEAFIDQAALPEGYGDED